VEFLERWLNIRLLTEPMNWAIVFVIATIWLLAFHTVMTAYQAMSGPKNQPAFGNPGQIAAPTAGTTGAFSAPGIDNPSTSVFAGGAMTWTDGSESRYAEDGWTGNS
jgi:hypothetical protein